MDSGILLFLAVHFHYARVHAMRILDEYPAVRWILATSGIVGTLATIGSGFWYIEDQRRAMEGLHAEILRARSAENESDAKWMHDDEVRHERQDKALIAIRDDIAMMREELRQQSEKIADGERAHGFIAEEIFRLHYRFGFHAGQHSQIDTLKGH